MTQNKEKNDTDKVENRKKILECALYLFYSKGYDAVGVQEIAARAGVTKPTLYYYFKSKYGLLQCLLKDYCSDLNYKLKNAGEFNGDLLLTLEKLGTVYLKNAADNPQFYYLMVSLFYSARENEAYLAIKPYMIEQFRIITDVFCEAAPLLGNMNGRQEQFAIGFTGILNHYILVYYEREVKGRGLMEPDVIHLLVQQFMYGIFS